MGPSSNYQPTLTPSHFHQLGDLYFCPQCHMLRCVECCDVDVECKYCVNCMTDYSDIQGVVRCTKNCFECPECSSVLVVSMEDTTSGEAKGKQFTFLCVSCELSYKTKVVTKPAALSTILKNENSSGFASLYELYSLRNKASQREKPLSASVLSRMKAMDISQPKTATSEPEKLVLEQKRSSPLGKHLVAKRKYLCSTCCAALAVPVPDPRLMKFVNKHFACDTVPTIVAKTKGSALNSVLGVGHFAPGSETPCTFNVVNPLPSSINVTVSVLAQQHNPFTDKFPDFSVSFPHTHFVVPGRRENASVVDSIPTPILTSTTKTARAEQLMRASRHETLKRANREKTGAQDVQDPKEIGSHWVSVPFSVSVGETAPQNPLHIPFYVTVESKIPEQWKSTRRGLKYGFWVVCQIE